MKKIMIAAMSIDGKITSGNENNVYPWTSHEDQEFFAKQKAESNLIVMGLGTYLVIRPNLIVERERLRIVLTQAPEKYRNEEVKGALEFSSETPRELVSRLGEQYDKLLLVGGSIVYSSFIKAGLVDEIYLTIEPVVFGSGKPLFADGDFSANFQLDSMEKLNRKGTLLLKYSLKK